MKIASTTFAAAVLSGLLVTVAGSVLEFHSWRKQPTLQEALFLSPLPDRVHLYSGDRDAKTGKWVTPANSAIDLLGDDGVARTRFVQGKPGEDSEDIELKADGEHYARSQSFYPQDSTPGRHPHVLRVFADKTDEVAQEEDRAVNGYLQKRMSLNDDGLRQFDYASDGETILHELVTKKFYQWGSPEVAVERRWRDDKAHTLSYSDIRRPDSKGARVITEFDSQGFALKLSNVPDYGTVSGTSITSWYPDTRKVRFESHSDYDADTTTYYRPDGTRDYVLKLSSSMTEVTYFDASGLHETLEQQWNKQVTIVNDVPKTQYMLYSITEVDAQGQPMRTFSHSYGGGRLWLIETFNAVVDGVTYHEVDYDINKAGDLDSIRYWQKPVAAPPDKVEAQPPNTHLNVVEPADEAVLRVNPDLDDLPVPPPQRRGGGF